MTSQHRSIPHLRRRRLGVTHLFFTVAASAPLTVLGGGVTTTFAVANAGAFYSYLARGLGRTPAVAGSFVALPAYNAIQIGLFGLFGAGMSEFAAATVGLVLPWWEWAVAALLAVGALGHPAGGVVTTAGFDPAQLFVPGVGAALAFGIAAFVGFKSGAIYSEECRGPRVTVGRATFTTLAFFRGWRKAATVWQRLVAPGLATVLLGVLVVLVVVNVDALLGTDSTSPLRWVLPALVLVAAAAGGGWARYLRSRDPRVYAGIGRVALAPEVDAPAIDLEPAS